MNDKTPGISFIIEATLADRNSAYIERLHLLEMLTALAGNIYVKNELNELGIIADERCKPENTKILKNLSDDIGLKHSSFRGEEYLDNLSKAALSKLVNFSMEQLAFWFGAAMYCCSSDNETQSMTGKFIVNTELKFFTLVYNGLHISKEMSLQEFINFSHRTFINSVRQ
jgi:hypothetical protein